MSKKYKIVVEEVFANDDIEKRREIFTSIFVNIIKKMELHKVV